MDAWEKARETWKNEKPKLLGKEPLVIKSLRKFPRIFRLETLIEVDELELEGIQWIDAMMEILLTKDEKMYQYDDTFYDIAKTLKSIAQNIDSPALIKCADDLEKLPIFRTGSKERNDGVINNYFNDSTVPKSKGQIFTNGTVYQNHGTVNNFTVMRNSSSPNGIVFTQGKVEINYPGGKVNFF